MDRSAVEGHVPEERSILLSRGLPEPPEHVFAVFDAQDSGCVAWGAVLGGQPVFLKASRCARAIASLRRAVGVHRMVRHPTIVPLLGHHASEEGIVLVYPWVHGRSLYLPRARRDDPEGAVATFARLSLDERLAATEAVISAHVALCAAGLVSVDLYDGSFLYDFTRGVLHLVDLDEYRPSPFRVEGDRLPGSARFMAPEESRRGAWIDERTTVFHLGRTTQVLLGQVPQQLEAVIRRATSPEPGQRHPTVEALAADWRRWR